MDHLALTTFSAILLVIGQVVGRYLFYAVMVISGIGLS
ncbi:MAG: hypothetical protein H6Q63_633 [Firmicutes bacterium]|nr:hypothetical protein [Bacillota bacterium]